MRGDVPPYLGRRCRWLSTAIRHELVMMTATKKTGLGIATARTGFGHYWLCINLHALNVFRIAYSFPSVYHSFMYSVRRGIIALS
jgi:hypothetical protein